VIVRIAGKSMQILMMLAVVLSSLSPLAGCAANVQIWGNSDADSLVDYTARNPHYVHVGETTQFRVTVEPDIASYVTMKFGDKLSILRQARPGQYAFNYHFDQRWLNRSTRLEVRAYKQVGRRDFVRLQGRVLPRRRTGDDPDRLLGTAAMTVRCYQSKMTLKLAIPRQAKPIWEKARLEIFGPRGRVTRVGPGKPGEHGFTVLGIEALSNKHVVLYEPTYDQVRRTGKTKAVLVVPTTGGRTIRQETWIDTP